ncbi:MAG: Hsp33 family molecular chaperone HslO [Sulfurimicrobium sp.]|nr:Hsp33 family molecular chaperone HslO [Sulfurimicrobium sp.]MDP2200237.1 Hsp33 family molecular chaperone HslO [Sulfurimicrobium sp.]MDP3688720.1 Hsp33 family molecular chaperone HslO [Sulfurimicrobium sp.]
MQHIFTLDIDLENRDSLQRFMFEHAAVRGEIVHLDTTWQAVLERREYPPVLRGMLGELMAAAALLAASLKFSGSIILQMQGEGVVKLLVVECQSDLTMRAMAHWEGEVVGESLAELLGNGRFVITIDPRNGKKTYQGIVDLAGQSVADALEDYMSRSEQLDTRLWLAADEHQAAGMLLQKMPERHEEDADAWQRAVHFASTLTRKELLGLPSRQIIHRLYHEEDIRLFDPQAVNFHCPCSRERVAGMLRMLGHEEVQAVLQEQDAIEVDCEFCNKHYVFDKVDVEQAFASEVPTEAPKHLH